MPGQDIVIGHLSAARCLRVIVAFVPITDCGSYRAHVLDERFIMKESCDGKHVLVAQELVPERRQASPSFDGVRYTRPLAADTGNDISATLQSRFTSASYDLCDRQMEHPLVCPALPGTLRRIAPPSAESSRGRNWRWRIPANVA